MCDSRKSREFCDSAYEKIEEAKAKARVAIREHPLVSVAIAAGVGAVAGVAVSEGIRAVIRSRRN
jgi:ElaB/YqjD/DUF883 family membrane-anchored ribosome-binding protein